MPGLKHRLESAPARAAGALLSGCLLALAGGLHPSWWAAWFASVPVLVVAYRSSGRAAWSLGLLAGLTGEVSSFDYYATVATIPTALVITALKAALFAGGVRLAWGARGRLSAGLALFAFPSWFAAFDTLIATFSANGTAGSLAYSQMDRPPVLQIASLFGAPAVTFVVCLASSALAHGMAPLPAPRRLLVSVSPALAIIAAAVGFGIWRTEAAPAEPTILVALAALDPERPLPADWRASLEAYRPLLAQAGARHARLMVLPEEIALVSGDELGSIRTELGGFARDSAMELAVGFRVTEGGTLRNLLLLFTRDGRVLTYDKQHLVPGIEMPKITPGRNPPMIAEVDGHRLGGAICKDFDFVDVGRSLSLGRAGLVVAPAWDFGQDAWLHGRMAMLRAVEGGFTLVRSAREGSMTVSDRLGRVLAEVRSGPAAPLLLAEAPLPASQPTVYARARDVFGWACVGMVLLFLLHRVTKNLSPELSPGGACSAERLGGRTAGTGDSGTKSPANPEGSRGR